VPVRSLAAIIVWLFLLWPQAASAQSCSFTISNMAFGNIDTLSATPTDVTATLGISCTGVTLTTVRICSSIGAGSGGATATQRRMSSGTALLNYQLYSNAGRTTIWGSYSWAFAATPPTINLPLGIGGSASTNVLIYGRVFGSQASATPGTYLSSFAGDTTFIYATAALLPCPNMLLPQQASPSFVASATVPGTCNVFAQDLDFGTSGGLGANLDATGQLSVNCVPGTAYTIGLDDGLANAGVAARKMTLGANTVSYGLYRNAARNLVWGDTIGVNTLAGTGDGTLHAIPIYGRVPPQALPPAGTYRDTIVVTVTY
jgi:spore coat protein U-like protein